MPAVFLQREPWLYYRIDDSGAAANGDDGNGDADLDDGDVDNDGDEDDDDDDGDDDDSDNDDDDGDNDEGDDNVDGGDDDNDMGTAVRFAASCACWLLSLVAAAACRLLLLLRSYCWRRTLRTLLLLVLPFFLLELPFVFLFE